MEEISKYPKSEDEIMDFYCFAPKNDEEISRMLGKKKEFGAKIFTPDWGVERFT